MPPVIRIENLSKSYRIQHGAARSEYHTLRETLTNLAAAPFRRLRGRSNGRVEEFWALKDVNLEVQQGEVVGIIGRNGAGKSTLLKILSRITAPTAGRVELRGRVASLLEVGTGFHPELTGRENIFLNGSILGMSRCEILKKFDNIVDFAGVERFLDTPVKRYSSGMYVRLAFALAAHLDPEILFVDEVLAVGDMAFQRKCLGRMREVSRSGRTILFVSHNMAAIESLCSRAVMVDAGQLVMDGDVVRVTREYSQRNRNSNSVRDATEFDRRRGSMIREVTVLDDSGNPNDIIPLGSQLHLRVRLCPRATVVNPTIGVGINDTMGQRQISVHTPLNGATITRITPDCEVHCRISPLPLIPGDYWVKLDITHPERGVETLDQAVFFTVVDANAFGEGRGFHRGICIAPSRWECIDHVTGHTPPRSTMQPAPSSDAHTRVYSA